MFSSKFSHDSFQMVHLFFPCVFICPYSSFLLHLSHLTPTHKVQSAAPEADDCSKSFSGTFFPYVFFHTDDNTLKGVKWTLDIVAPLLRLYIFS